MQAKHGPLPKVSPDSDGLVVIPVKTVAQMLTMQRFQCPLGSLAGCEPSPRIVRFSSTFGTLYHDGGTASIKLVKWGDGHTVISFSSDPKSNKPCFEVKRSTSDDVDAFVTTDVSFTWRNSAVPDIEVGWRDPAIVVASGNLAPG